MKWCLVLQPSASSSSSSQAWESKRGLILAASIGALGAAASFAIYQLSKILYSVLRDSEYEAAKLITALTAAINSDNPDVEVPEELEVFDDIEDIYTYGSLQELFYRRSLRGDTDWEWSFDCDEWYSTADLSPGHTLVLDPPSIIFVARLHLQSVARRKFAAAAAGQGSSNSTAGRGAQQVSRIPPPVELPNWAKQQLEHHLAAATGKSATAGRHQQQSSRNGTVNSISSSSRAATDTSLRGVGGEGSSSKTGDWLGSRAGSSSMRVEDAPDMLCCPITGQIMLQPVTLPSGKTFEYEAVRRWVSQHGTDPTTLTPVSILDLHPNLLIREMVEKWLAGQDPLADGHQE